jgi:hypothetical protein
MGIAPLILNFDTEVNGQLHASAALSSGKAFTLPAEYETTWARARLDALDKRRRNFLPLSAIEAPRNSHWDGLHSSSSVFACQFLVPQCSTLTNLSPEDGQMAYWGLQVHRNLYIKEMDVLQSTRTMTDAGTSYGV